MMIVSMKKRVSNNLNLALGAASEAILAIMAVKTCLDSNVVGEAVSPTRKLQDIVGRLKRATDDSFSAVSECAAKLRGKQ